MHNAHGLVVCLKICKTKKKKKKSTPNSELSAPVASEQSAPKLSPKLQHVSAVAELPSWTCTTSSTNADMASGYTPKAHGG